MRRVAPAVTRMAHDDHVAGLEKGIRRPAVGEQLDRAGEDDAIVERGCGVHPTAGAAATLVLGHAGARSQREAEGRRAAFGRIVDPRGEHTRVDGVGVRRWRRLGGVIDPYHLRAAARKAVVGPSDTT